MKFSLVIPFFNEEEGAKSVVESLVETIDETLHDYELILIDNGSVDRTYQILEDLTRGKQGRIKILRIPLNQGYGWGIITGLNAASGTYIGYMCGDGQISPKDVIKVFDRVQDGECDLAKVKRVARHDGLIRKLLSIAYNSLFFLLFKARTLDVNGSPKILSREAFGLIKPVSKDWFIDAEILIKAKYLGLRVSEVPVEFLRREAGRSHVRFSTISEFIKNLAAYRFGQGMREWRKTSKL